MRTTLKRAGLLSTVLTVLNTENFAATGWELTTSNDDCSAYIDKGTIRQSGHIVKIWGLTDYKTVKINTEGKRYLSDKTQWEYDCHEEMKRLRYLMQNTGPMGEGRVVQSINNPNDEWVPIVPGSLNALE